MLTLIFLILAGTLSAQEDSIRKQEVQEMKSELDSLEIAVQSFKREMDSLQAALTAQDTLRMYMEMPDVNYRLGDQKVVVFRLSGFEMDDPDAISTYINFRSKLSSRGFHLMQYNDEGTLVCTGQWTSKGYQSDVVEYNSERKVIAIWHKSNDGFNREELE